MTSVKTHDEHIGVGALLEHGRARLRALGEAPKSRSFAPFRRRTRVFVLDRLLLSIGRAALWKGYDTLGLRASLAAANANPNSTKANLVAAIACRRASAPDAALFYARRAAANDDSSKRGNWELAKLLLREATAHDLRSELLAALRQTSHSTDDAIRHAALTALSQALCESGEYTEAEIAAEAVLSASPDDMRPLRAKANSLVPQNRFVEAAALYRKMLSRESGNAEIARKLQVLDDLAEEAKQPPAYALAGAQSKQPLLIGVGSGLGDILHATPMIRNIARQTRAPVEVVVAADHPHAEFLVGNPLYVSRVWRVSRAVLERPYDTVFLTEFFGPLRFAFRADRILASSDWRKFRAGMLNDTLLNLEAAKHLLGIPYDEEDVQHYFAGDLIWRSPVEPFVGIHAGSKSGRWLSKRWPHFAELAARLAARGIRVASFGTPDEYVPGTENRTGGSIEEMCRAMLACSHFVSNDSGPMHIASALGMPVLALYAPTDALSHLPIRASTIAFALNKSCSPCEVKDHGHFASGACRCIAEITADAVEAKLIEMLALSRPNSSVDVAPLVSEGAA